MDLLQTSTWRDIEDIEEEVRELLKCDDINCQIDGQRILISYDLNQIPDEREIRKLILYGIFDLEGGVMFEDYNGFVSVRFSVKTE